MRRLLHKLIIPGKIAGLLFLIFHLLTEKNEFKPLVIVYYLLFTALLAGLWFGGNILLSYFSKSYDDKLEEDEQNASIALMKIKAEVKRNPWQILLIPGEDGFFFLPLLYIGINPLSAFIAAALFAAAHCAYKSLNACIGTFFIAYFLCLLVLPQGIIPMVAGHLIVDISVFLCLPYMNKTKLDGSSAS
ncbi:MAG: hypothetical protein A2017_10245 [Lentisphaerae bacterium GWF2_44_16]|nr:MAG: hypothetical protein A2017_10245 [Lentisphaerae bacterium GWF2_44_16]